MRYRWLVGLVSLLCTAAPTAAQISVRIGAPTLDIGIHLPAIPNLTIVPGSPVYYAPSVDSNSTYFRGWAATAPPRWGDHWGSGWEQKHPAWNQVDRSHQPPPAPVPNYQRQYTEKRYPTPQQQPVLHSQNYKYQPREPVVQQHYQEHAAPQQHARPAREEERGQERR